MRGLALGMVLAIAGCSSSDPRERFERDVAPVLEAYCLSSACHGVAPGAEADGEVLEAGYFLVDLDERGVIADMDAAYRITRARISTVEPSAVSSLLRKPLAPMAGGALHRGGIQFATTEHEGYRALADWIEAEDGGGEGADRSELTPLQRQFADEVQPHLASLQCMNAACHGELAPFTSFQPPILVDGAPYSSIEATRHNYAAARMHLHLGGDPTRSRLLRKGLPMHAGGIPHRGGNDIFFRADGAAAAAITAWAEAEREAALGAAPEVTGIVFVRGPIAAAGAFDHDAYTPGTDLYVLAPPVPGGAVRNLTAAAHPDGPADVRDPSVRHDGAAVVFSMRRGADDGFNLYEIGVDGTGLRQLTDDRAALPGGGVAANVQPTYGPDGRVYFTSTRAGHLADDGLGLDTEIWAVDPATRALERLTYTPSPEAAPSFIGTGKSYGTLAFTMQRTIGGRYEAPVLRMPLDHNKAYHGDPELHIHHGVSLDGEIVYAMRTMPDGRFVCTLFDRDSAWRGGRLALFERQFGPELPLGVEDQAAVGGFRHAFDAVDPAVATGGVSEGGAYRRPSPLPDGRLLVSWSPGPLDLSDAGASPDYGVYLVSLADDGSRPLLARRELLIDEPGVADFDAEPIVRRPLEDDPAHEPAWDPTRREPTGVLALRHVQTLEAVFSNLEQRGVKILRDDLAYARLVEAVLESPNDMAAAPAGPGVTGVARVLAEIPLRGGSIYARVPADRPFRLQLLDRDRMAVGAQHNRWIHVAPGETFPGGVSPALYPALCAGCHGGASGDRADVGGPVPDAVTAASMTLATHANLDPRRPLAPEAIDAGGLEVDYRRDVAPAIARSCATARCHGAAAPAGGLDLVARPGMPYESAYVALRAHVVPGRARASALVERVLGRELDAPAPLAGTCPGEPALSSEERVTLTRWIDLGASYRGGAP